MFYLCINKFMLIFEYRKELTTILNIKIMTTQEIYTLANELTSQEVNNIVGGWENENETETINTFNCLVRLGDSRELACATAISEKYNKKEVSEIYRIAYES